MYVMLLIFTSGPLAAEPPTVLQVDGVSRFVSMEVCAAKAMDMAPKIATLLKTQGKDYTFKVSCIEYARGSGTSV